MDIKDKWNQKYMDKLSNQSLQEPNKRLSSMDRYLNGGTAIDYASGLGGNSIYLAQKGYNVTAVDISEVAVQYVREQAAIRKLKITAKISDLTRDRSDLTSRKYDLAVITYYLDRSLFPLIKQAINADGYIFFETFFKNRESGNQHIPDQYKLGSKELLEEFKEWKILFFEENEEEGRQTIFCQNTKESC